MHSTTRTRRISMKGIIRSLGIGALTIAVALAVALIDTKAIAQTEPPLKVSLAFYKATYNLDDYAEKIKAEIIIENNTGSPVYVPADFDQWTFHLHLFFKGPGADGQLITATSSGGGSTTPSVALPKVKVAKKPSPWRVSIPISELRDYYPLTQPGQYKAWFSIPFAQYDPQMVSLGSDGYYEAPFDAVIWNKPLETQQEYYITLAREVPSKTSSIRVNCMEYIFGLGTRPGVTKQPIAYNLASPFDVRLYRRSDIENAKITPINHQTCNRIVTEVTAYRYTSVFISGECVFEKVPQDSYVIIGVANGRTDYKHLWSPVAADDPKWGVGEILRNLILMTDNRGKKSPGKTTKLTGSELLIVEPEYVEWTSAQELYPFAFESVGSWGVEVSIVPPGGFVTDYKALSQDVSSTLKAVQFTMTDVGSEWKATKVKYKIKHNKKTISLERTIGIKLSLKLAKEKGVPIWGQ
jgi:hypothetical protein